MKPELQMLMSSDLGPLKKNGSASRFIIYLRRNADGEIQVESCSVTSAYFWNRVSFPRHSDLEAALIPEIAECLRNSASQLNDETKVLSFPDLIIETEGLILAGLQITSNKAANDQLHLVCRFEHFLGGINRAFSHSIGFDEVVTSELDRLSTLVLSDLAMPILNFCDYLRTNHGNSDHSLVDYTDTLYDRAQEIFFQIELIKRFVSQSEIKEKAALRKAVSDRPIANTNNPILSARDTSPKPHV